MDTQTRRERDFDVAMKDIYPQAARLGYWPTGLRKMVHDHGGLEAAHLLLAAPEAQSGLTELWLLGRIDLSVEPLALTPEFAPLFSEDELNRARARLDQVGLGVRPDR